MGSGVGPLAMITRSSDRKAGTFVLCAVRVCLKEDGGVLGHASARSRQDQKRKALPPSAFRFQEKDRDQANRAIRTGRLNALLRFHPRPINVVVFHGSQARPGLEGGFPLRCLQRLSRPHIATRRCRWRDNRYTRGASIPVLSY
jgi:hypothetical protein